MKLNVQTDETGAQPEMKRLNREYSCSIVFIAVGLLVLAAGIAIHFIIPTIFKSVCYQCTLALVGSGTLNEIVKIHFGPKVGLFRPLTSSIIRGPWVRSPASYFFLSESL